MIHRVNNVQEAVELAAEFKKSGRYNWFRGQTQNWPLVSSLCRVASEQMEDVMEKVARFEQWIKFTQGLESIAANTDMTIAVGQHYGLPTNFIDFTTAPPVAGFFASHGTPGERPSCIMCLDTEDLAKFWKNLRRVSGGPAPEFIELTVPNLWRLEAQHGSFLFCPFQEFEHLYDLDRIIFPYTVPITDPPANLIYPARKSQLEILLDQYFMNEKLIEGTRAMHARSSFTVVDIPRQAEKCDRELVPNGLPPRPDSWNDRVIAAWRQITPEVFSEKLTTERWEIKTNSEDDPSSRLLRVSDQVEERLAHSPAARQSLMGWSLGLEGSSVPRSASAQITRSLQLLWDGLRLLPYTDQQIAQGMACCAALAIEWLKLGAVDPDGWEDVFRPVFPDAMEFEFGSDDGSYSRAYVSKSILLEAVRPNIATFLSTAYKDQVLNNITGLLQAIWAPDRLFEYDRLSDAFATVIAPAQVWMRKGSAIFYSPARLDTFGLP